jgi:CCR4-NOT transcription complex subunit 1
MNLVLSSSFHKLPNLYIEGLKIERLEEMREAPKIAEGVAPLLKAHNNVVGEASIQQVSRSYI